MSHRARVKSCARLNGRENGTRRNDNYRDEHRLWARPGALHPRLGRGRRSPLPTLPARRSQERAPARFEHLFDFVRFRCVIRHRVHIMCHDDAMLVSRPI